MTSKNVVGSDLQPRGLLENMPYCIAFGCDNSTDQRCSGISFHRLPLKDPRHLKQWLAALKLVDPPIADVNARVCSQHFERRCFLTRMQETLTGKPCKRLLSPDAVPSIFAYSVPTKRRAISETRSQSKRSKELLEGALERLSSIEAAYPPRPHTSTEDDIVELPLTADESETLAADVSTAETSIECRSIGIQTGKYLNLNSIIV